MRHLLLLALVSTTIGLTHAAEDADTYFAQILLDAKAGNAESQVRAGNMYKFGMGVTRDLAEAERWYNLGGRPELLNPEPIAIDNSAVLQVAAAESAAIDTRNMSQAEIRELDTNDPMQQVFNYLITGDPLNRRLMGKYGIAYVEAYIEDREECIMGIRGTNFGYVPYLIYFNNIDIKGIDIETEYIDQDTASIKRLESGYYEHLKVTGYPVAVKYQYMDRRGNQDVTTASLILGDIDRRRATEALALLYRDYCNGSGSESAF